jgi:hypothetical protein
MVNLSFPNQSIGCITGCGEVAMSPKAARDTKDMIMVMMFSLWIAFAVAILIFCGFCYCRRHAQNVQLFESPGFDEALQSYVLATFAHAQRMARLTKRKEKLAELELHKTEMVCEVHTFLVHHYHFEGLTFSMFFFLCSSVHSSFFQLVTKECFVIEAGKKSLEIPSGNSSSIKDRPQKEQTSATKVLETQISILGNDDDDQTDIASDNVSSLIALFVNLPEYYPESTKQYPNGGPRQVPNSCAICLENFSVGDHLCWSANVSCSHAFHFECIIPWCNKIIKEQPTTKSCACPCCRQEFVQFEFEDDEEYCAEAEHSSVTSEENHPQDHPS